VYQTSDATGPVTLKVELVSEVTPPVAVAATVRFDPMVALQPLKVKMPCDRAGVHVRAVLPILAEIVPL
jgi:hypothetical protein